MSWNGMWSSTRQCRIRSKRRNRLTPALSAAAAISDIINIANEIRVSDAVARIALRPIRATKPTKSQEIPMHGKVILVTGASGALGRVVAATALARGARVAGVDHAKSQVGETADRMELGGVDLSDAEQAKQAVDAVATRFGRLDVLVNIAGAFSFETIAEGDPKTWARLYAINVLTALNASRAAIPHLTASTAGRIVNIGALGAVQAGRGMGPYAASKAGVHRL